MPIDCDTQLKNPLLCSIRCPVFALFSRDSHPKFTNFSPKPSNNNAKHISSLYELFSFKQLIEEPTRVTLDTATVTDHVATTCPRNIIKSGVLEVSLSDHYFTLYCIRKFNGAVEKGHKKETRKMKNFNDEAFLADVSGICWEQMLTETDELMISICLSTICFV